MIAIGHAVTINILTRMRDRLDVENVTKRRMENAEPPAAPTITPAYPAENTYEVTDGS